MNDAGHLSGCFKYGPWNGLGVTKIKAYLASAKIKKSTRRAKKVSSTNV